jgi:hypothetical protein
MKGGRYVKHIKKSQKCKLHKCKKRKTHKRKLHKRKLNKRKSNKRKSNKRKIHSRRLKGGWNSGKSGPVGYPWDASPSSWPGSGNGNNGNHYKLSSCGISAGPCDPPNSTRNQNGGGIFPQDLVNLGRSIKGEFMAGIDSLRGVPRSASSYSSPTHQPIDKQVEYISRPVPDVNKIHNSAGKSVALI